MIPLAVGTRRYGRAVTATITHVMGAPTSDTALETLALAGGVLPPKEALRALFGFGAVNAGFAGEVTKHAEKAIGHQRSSGSGGVNLEADQRRGQFCANGEDPLDSEDEWRGTISRAVGRPTLELTENRLIRSQISRNPTSHHKIATGGWGMTDRRRRRRFSWKTNNGEGTKSIMGRSRIDYKRVEGVEGSHRRCVDEEVPPGKPTNTEGNKVKRTGYSHERFVKVNDGSGNGARENDRGDCRRTITARMDVRKRGSSGSGGSRGVAARRSRDGGESGRVRREHVEFHFCYESRVHRRHRITRGSTRSSAGGTLLSR